MRILAIRGENLASLAEAFVVDFEQEPLRSSGLFAITGETGAGKSTILDALCLALYDKFPRVETQGTNEGSPDPSGEVLGVRDPAAILRRGAGHGYAEADFVGRDGHRYRARCDLRRARGRATGNLQPRGRSLWRIDETGAQIATLESGVEPVNRRIVELTDLTFDQFRRTALLAQGDFDAFLRADANARAELLEKITGAEIYGLLSRRAYEHAREAQRNMAALEQRQADVGVMRDEDRQEIADEIAVAEDARAKLTEERAATRAALARRDAAIQAQAKLAQAEAECARAVVAYEAKAQVRETLAALSLIEPLRAYDDARRRAEKAHQETSDACAVSARRMQHAQKALEDAQLQSQRSGNALAAVETEIKAFAPVWTQAAELDLRIADAVTAELRMRGEASAARQGAKEKAQLFAQAQEMRAEKERARARAQNDCARLASVQPLSERWTEIDGWLAKRVELCGARAAATAALKRIKDDLARAGALSVAYDAADAADRETRETLSKQLREREAALAAIDETAAQQRSDALARLEEGLSKLIRCASDFDDAREQQAATQAQARALSEECAQLDEKLRGLNAARKEQATAFAEADKLGELAEAMADPDALRLRASLEDEAPCPVCGGRDHPFAHAQDAAHQLVAKLREKREVARAELNETDDALVQTQTRAASRGGLHEAAQQSLKELEEKCASLRQSYHALRAEYAEASAPEEAEGAAARLDAHRATVAQQRREVTAKCDAARKLREEITRLRKQFDAVRDALEERQRLREDDEKKRADAKESQARTEQALKGNIERIESLDASLSPFLAACDLSAADLDRDGAGARARLLKAGEGFTSAKARLFTLDDELKELAVTTARLEAEALGAAEVAGKSDASWRAAAQQHETLRAQRGALLGGEATATHRERTENRREAALAAQRSAQQALGDAVTAFATAQAGHARDTEAFTQAEVGLSAAQTAFFAQLASTGIEEARAVELLALSPEETQSLRQQVAAVAEALRIAEGAVAERRRDVAESAIDADATPRETLAADEAALGKQIDELSARSAAVQEQLRQDDAARAKVEAFAAEIDAARSTRKVWDEISEAIGSATGDKFRRFAQSVTLEHLVALANQRLALLAPRYLLERAGDPGALGLQIVDRDLGDERRSTRSLSGGERFLASLALALALAGLEGRDSFVDTLFIDEGFGALDSATLDVAIDALENLQGQGRKVGVISHVESLQQRIATKISVERRGGGLSVVRLRAAARA